MGTLPSGPHGVIYYYYCCYYGIIIIAMTIIIINDNNNINLFVLHLLCTDETKSASLNWIKNKVKKNNKNENEQKQYFKCWSAGFILL